MDFCEQLLQCHELLGLKVPKKKLVRPYTPQLTPEEQRLFDENDYLSAYQSVIANACGPHRQRQKVELEPSASHAFSTSVEPSDIQSCIRRPT